MFDDFHKAIQHMFLRSKMNILNMYMCYLGIPTDVTLTKFNAYIAQEGTTCLGKRQ